MFQDLRMRFSLLVAFMFVFLILGMSVDTTTSSKMVSNVSYLPTLKESKMLRRSVSHSDVESEEIDGARMSKMSSTTESESLGQTFVSQLDQSTSDDRSSSHIDKGPMLVHNGRLEATAQDVKSTAESIEALVVSKGGFTESRASHGSSYTDTQRPPSFYQHVEMTLRVVSQEYSETLQAIQTIVIQGGGRVTYLTTNTKDVTEEFVDTLARASVLDTTRSSMKALLAKAESVKDVIQINKELTVLSQQYESYVQRAKHLKQQSSFSTLVLIIREERNEIFSETVSWKPLETAQKAWALVMERFASVGNMIVFFVVMMLPIAGLALLLTVCCHFLTFARNSRKIGSS